MWRRLETDFFGHIFFPAQLLLHGFFSRQTFTLWIFLLPVFYSMDHPFTYGRSGHSTINTVLPFSSFVGIFTCTVFPRIPLSPPFGGLPQTPVYATSTSTKWSGVFAMTTSIPSAHSPLSVITLPAHLSFLHHQPSPSSRLNTQTSKNCFKKPQWLQVQGCLISLIF